MNMFVANFLAGNRDLTDWGPEGQSHGLKRSKTKKEGQTEKVLPGVG